MRFATVQRELLRLLASLGSVWLVALVMIFFPVVLLMLTLAAMITGTTWALVVVVKRLFHRIRQKRVLNEKRISEPHKEDNHARPRVFHLASE